MIQQVTIAMHNKVGLGKVGNCCAVYPTYADGIKTLTDQFNRTRLTPFTKILLKGVLKFI